MSDRQLDFRELSVGNYLCWNEEIKWTTHLLNSCPDDESSARPLWEQEPLECVLEVVRVGQRPGGEREISFVCVRDCGGHQVERITEKKFEAMALLLHTGSPLVHASMQVLGEVMGGGLGGIPPSKNPYSFLADLGNIFELVDDRSLPYLPGRRKA